MKFYHTQENRNEKLENPIFCSKPNAWLGNAFYFWENEDDADFWGITTDAPDGLKHFVREGVKKKFSEEFSTGNYRHLAKERYAFGWSDWRGMYSGGN